MVSSTNVLASILAAAACAAFTLAGCGAPETGAPEGDGPMAADLAGEATESEDATPPNDDPSIGAVVETDVDTSAADETDIIEVFELDSLRRVASPVPGRRVTYPYGVRNPRYAAGYHTGDDYATSVGSSVVAVRAGRIRWSNDNGGAYGKWMGLDADNGRTYVYCHLSRRLFSAGKRVVAGQRIARSGATGNVTGPHLHFEDHPHGPFHYGQDRKPRW